MSTARALLVEYETNSRKLRRCTSPIPSKQYQATGTHMPHGITQCYLPPDRGDIPAFTPAEAGGYSIKRPRGMQSWVDLVGLLHTEMVYPPEDGHPSKY